MVPTITFFFATDLSEEAGWVANVLRGLDLGPQARLSALNVFEAPELRLVMSQLGKQEKDGILAEARGAAAGALAELGRQIGLRWSEQLVRHKEATTGHEILLAAKEAQADLVVVATRRTGLAKLLLGSVAEEVLREADRDVLAIPPNRRDEP